MNNLKRVLSLALSGIMLVGMMAMGASAVDFSDADKINNTDAVNTLVSLGVINGKDDGSYGPEEIVTRAQMAKMICVTLNGGKDFKYGTKATPTYSDIKGHWAESYIEYCTSLNIIAGQGDGTFNPDGPVTASAASKMMLVAIGYDADDEGMVGIDWEVNTNRLADNKGFYKDLKALNVSEGLSRDNAAQVIFNACGAKMVEYDYKLVTNDGNLATKPVAKDLGYDIFAKKFEVNTDEDVVLTKVHLVTSGVNKGTYTLNDGAYTKVAEDCTSLLGQTVKVLYKDTDEVFGVYADAKNTVVTTNQSAITVDGAKVKFDGTKYELESDCYTIVDGVVVGTSSGNPAVFTPTVVDADDLKNATSYNKVALIDNDGNNKYDVAVITTVTPAKVTYVSSDEIIAGGETYKYEDETIAEGLKKNDYVTVTYSIGTDKNVIEKVEAVEATIEATKGTSPVECRIDGVWYKNAGAALNAGDDATIYAVNGVIYYSEATSTTTLDDVVLMVEKDSTSMNKQAKIMHTDGSVEIVKLTDKPGTGFVANTSLIAGTLYTATKTSDGYKFKAVSGNIGDYKWVAPGNVATDGTLASKEVADDAVILGLSASGAVTEVYTGKQFKALAADAHASDAGKFLTTAGALGAFTNTVKGLERVVFGAVKVNGDGTNMPKGGAAETYGLVLTAPINVKDALSYDIWTGEETITVTDEDKVAVTKGAVIVYSEITDGKIANVAVKDTAATLTTNKLVNASIQAMDGTEKLYLNGNASTNMYEIVKDTVVMYYDSENMEGKPGGEIQLADDVEGCFIENVKAIVNTSTQEIDFLLVDTKNKLDDATEYTVTFASTASTEVATITANKGEDALTSGDATTTFPAGTVIDITITATAAGGDVKVTVTNGEIIDLATDGKYTLTANQVLKLQAVVGAGNLSVTVAPDAG